MSSQTSPPRDSFKKAKTHADTAYKNHPSPQQQPQKKPVSKRSISFDEVYQRGQAEYKHLIIEFPPNEGNWYILKCEEHGMHFGLNPLRSAAKHLNSSKHKKMSQQHWLAVEVLGYFVFDCDAAMAERNNAAVTKAFERGYKPYTCNTPRVFP